VLFLIAVAIGLVGLERYSAGLGLERFMTRTRQVTNAMPEDAVIKKMGGQPNDQIDLRLHKEDYDTCRKAGAATVMVYLCDHVGWFRNFGLTSWLCLLKSQYLLIPLILQATTAYAHRASCPSSLRSC